MRQPSRNAKTRAALQKADWKRLSSRGAETWIDPCNATLHSFAAASQVEREWDQRDPFAHSRLTAPRTVGDGWHTSSHLTFSDGPPLDVEDIA